MKECQQTNILGLNMFAFFFFFFAFILLSSGLAFLSRDWPAKVNLKSRAWASLVAQVVKNLPAMQETPVQFLGWEDPLEKGGATHSSILP